VNTVLLPDLALWIDEEPTDSDTLLVVVGRGSLMLISFVPSSGHGLHSSYVEAGGDTVVASHLLVTTGTGPVPTTSTLVDRDLHRPGDRRRCLLEHLAMLRDALERSGDRLVRMEVGEEALQATGTLAHHPD
jgi:hypothetical protein